MIKMKQRAVLFLVLICAILAVGGTDCDCDPAEYLKVPTIHYRELGCTPIKDANQCCIERFDCPERKKDIPDIAFDPVELQRQGKCEFRDIIYNDRDKIPGFGFVCMVDCFCDAGQISCTNVECPDLFHPQPRPDCIKQYNEGDCCATYVCGEAEIAKLVTCEFEGKWYRSGQSMKSNVDKCVKCTCEEGFDGKLDSKFCNKTTSCGIDRFYKNRLIGCAPIYYENDECCPNNWRCPAPTDQVITAINKSSEDLALECTFGNLTLTRKDSLTLGNVPCTICNCAVPPMVSCTLCIPPT